MKKLLVLCLAVSSFTVMAKVKTVECNKSVDAVKVVKLRANQKIPCKRGAPLAIQDSVERVKMKLNSRAGHTFAEEAGFVKK